MLTNNHIPGLAPVSFIVDTNSLNHTYVDGKQIPSGVETKLSDDSKFRLANETFAFRHKKA